jgi:hypothetical protein
MAAKRRRAVDADFVFILLFLLLLLAAKCLVRDDRKNNQWDFWDLWDSIPQSHGFYPIFMG